MSNPDFQDILDRLSRMKPVELELDALAAWAILGALQLALRHPHMRGMEIAKVVRMVAEGIQRILAAQDAEVGRQAERGFHEVFDVPREDQP